jgi:glycosyltransferase involved in cell wall biosynthesis
MCDGGAELIASREAKGLAARGVDVAVLAGRYAEGDGESGCIDLEQTDSVPVYRVLFQPSDQNENFRRPATAGYLRALIGAHRAELVHFHNVMGLGANLIPAAKETGVRVVVTLHDHWGFCFKNTVLRNEGRVCPNPQECAVCAPSVITESGRVVPMRMRRDYVAWCLEQADLLISPSVYLAGAYSAAGINVRIERLSYGADLTAVLADAKAPSQKVRFVCLAYIGEHKGIPVLLDAAERLARDETIAGRWSLTIAGPGPRVKGAQGPGLVEKLHEDIAAGRFAGAVNYVGQLAHRHAVELMNTSDVVVLASVWPENEPVSLLEAIASGKAQLASRIGGIPDLVEEEKSGLLFEPANASDLADKMRRYIADPALAARHGARNRDRRREFDEARTLDRLKELYDENAPPPRDAQVVICAGDCPKEVALLLERFYGIEHGRFQVRFIWHEWADAAIWRQAKLLWLWSDQPPLPTLTRALGQGLPVLAPAGSIAQQLEYPSGAVVGYATYLEAAAAIAALSGLPDGQWSIDRGAPDLARLVATIAPRDNFHLPTGTMV